MQVKALWGFKGDPTEVNDPEARVRAGTVLEVTDKYGHHLVGAGLAEPHEELDGEKKPVKAPKANKAAAPDENK